MQAQEQQPIGKVGKVLQWSRHQVQGRRKQFFSGQANQLQSCVYTEFKVMSGNKCKLLCEAYWACIAC